MREFKGTPGPWTFADEEGDVIIIGANGDVICVVGSWMTSSEEDMENARILAASHAILSVLQEALNAQVLPEYHAEKAKAAIAKALGESQ